MEIPGEEGAILPFGVPYGINHLGRVVLENNRGFHGDVSVIVVHTVDGSEIQRPTTVWMVLKPCK